MTIGRLPASYYAYVLSKRSYVHYLVNLCLNASPCLLVEHTASFWNIIIQRTSVDDLTEKLVSIVFLAKLVKWQKCKTAFCDLTEKLLVSNFIGQPNLQIILEAKSMDKTS